MYDLRLRICRFFAPNGQFFVGHDSLKSSQNLSRYPQSALYNRNVFVGKRSKRICNTEECKLNWTKMIPLGNYLLSEEK